MKRVCRFDFHRMLSDIVDKKRSQSDQQCAKNFPKKAKKKCQNNEEKHSLRRTILMIPSRNLYDRFSVILTCEKRLSTDVSVYEKKMNLSFFHFLFRH